MQPEHECGRRAARWRRILIGALAVLAAPAGAQDYPSRHIRLVIGFSAGGPTDGPARFLADRLSVSLGKPVVVENKPGAGSTLAANDVLGHPADGYELLLCTYLDAVNPLLYKNVRYKLSDLQGVSLIAKYSYAAALSKAIPAQNIAELIAYAKGHPGEVNYGYLGAGSTQSLLARKLEKLTGMQMTAIPYKGTADAMQEIIAGRNHLYIGPPLGVLRLYEAGQVNVVAVTGAERLASLPQVPTLVESGVPLVAYAWLGVCAAAGTPEPVIARLNAAIGDVVNSAAYRSLIETSGSVAVSSTPAELQRVIRQTADEAAAMVRELDVKLD